MAASLAERIAQLHAEQRLLLKADQDIEDGWQRIREQEDRVRELAAGGHNAEQAERLVDLLRQTLAEWDRHRTLIEQRVSYLRQQVELG
ncbi:MULTISPECIES: hypothetical protein [unclassified Bradyrhizobium]|uniref:hypothetical protein n=1 Tax=unclassified Bradyrhizobium TaxID=2631580 RepID=UPI00211E2D98|nr:MULTISPECIES: hypothetical protein [unclassified Bradyrhizobium]MDD1536282.1 hypothetical protein [Bradyrhizobium sp. WBOS8]MDD1586043.1 hypothetical protein [Bradyrhizobium sp. WBOS4]UUO48550.1 hypothetical protein DCM78_17535 [Bradyrhizobium sp. WBOS04]UUO62170.1 hypothetical protein DCM80_25280 [Bradyrhizobium sp. WBOS08]